MRQLIEIELVKSSPRLPDLTPPPVELSVGSGGTRFFFGGGHGTKLKFKNGSKMINFVLFSLLLGVRLVSEVPMPSPTPFAATECTLLLQQFWMTFKTRD